MKGGAKSKVLTSSLPPGGGAHSRALKLKSHNPCPSPLSGGAVVTNDWCMRSALPSMTKILGTNLLSYYYSAHLHSLVSCLQQHDFSYRGS